MNKTLTIADVIALSTIIDAASQGARVRWLADGSIREGVARHIVRGPSDFTFLTQEQDVRDGYLRITSGGMEITWLVSDLMDKVMAGEFVKD